MEAYPYIDGIAWHGYVGQPTAMSRVHREFPAESAYWTEGGLMINRLDYQTNWGVRGEMFNGILNNWSRSITAWNLVLDENGNPNIGPFHCGGLVTVENGSHTVTKSGQYWALAHLSRHVRRGAKVIATSGMDAVPAEQHMEDTRSTALTQSTFRNPDGSMVAVLANRGPRRKVQLAMSKMGLEIDVPADSVITLQWS